LGKFDASCEWYSVLLDLATFEHGYIFTQYWLWDHCGFGGSECKECRFLIVIESHIQEIVFLEEGVEMELCVIYATES
jgi:hypothetical protein